MTYTRKTFDNSYLFQKELDTHHKVLTEFIIKADRIEDKKSELFRGIVEDVKRVQNSSILYTVLMMDNVVLCYNKTNGLSRAFKVFEAKDIRYNHEPKVFIDVTGLITFKDGYFYCKRIDWLVTYLFNALVYLLYSKSTVKLIGNSDVSISGTECFVSTLNYIIDYLGIIGYRQNKEKISYLAGLYFQYNMMGKDLDMHAKNIAARTAGISTSDTRAFELYYDVEKDFVNIDTFINLISNTFKLKGLTTEVFIHKWIYQFGTGTQFASELLTSFFVLMTSAYSGAYVVNQKQIERCCGSSLVKLCNALLRLGASEFDNRGSMTESEFDSTVARDKNTQMLKEAFGRRGKIPSDAKLSKEDLTSKEKVKKSTEKMIEFLKDTKQEKKISSKVKANFYDATRALIQYVNNNSDSYGAGVLEVITKSGKDYLDKKDINLMIGDSELNINYWNTEISKIRSTDKDKAKRMAFAVTETRKAVNILNKI